MVLVSGHDPALAAHKSTASVTQATTATTPSTATTPTTTTTTTHADHEPRAPPAPRQHRPPRARAARAARGSARSPRASHERPQLSGPGGAPPRRAAGGVRLLRRRLHPDRGRRRAPGRGRRGRRCRPARAAGLASALLALQAGQRDHADEPGSAGSRPGQPDAPPPGRGGARCRPRDGRPGRRHPRGRDRARRLSPSASRAGVCRWSWRCAWPRCAGPAAPDPSSAAARMAVDHVTGTVQRPRGVVFDPGGIAKGVFADELAADAGWL